MNARQYERLWSAVRSVRDRFKTFEAALGRQQAHALYRAAASLVDAERRLLNIYYQEQTRDRQGHEEPKGDFETLLKAVSGVASVVDQVFAAIFIAAESDISADDRARTLLQRTIDEHRRIVRDLLAVWERLPRPRSEGGRGER
ncbi:MAG TPA: hypothetical protein VFJ58_16985 [Armatimonadota bacterium]|nr:hypothetical protein [Armatimonadota bacterium]